MNCVWLVCPHTYVVWSYCYLALAVKRLFDIVPDETVELQALRTVCKSIGYALKMPTLRPYDDLDALYNRTDSHMFYRKNH